MVRCDSRGGAYDLTRLLLNLGHRRIALLNGPGAVSTAADRAAGFQDALDEAGLRAGAAVLSGSFTQVSGAEMARQALWRDPQPTALIAGNNFIAIGALNALRELGLRVPEDIALAGFDDLPSALVTFPFLTVASQPAYAMGQAAMRLLLERLNGRQDDFCEIVLPVELIVRASSGEKLLSAQRSALSLKSAQITHYLIHLHLSSRITHSAINNLKEFHE